MKKTSLFIFALLLLGGLWSAFLPNVKMHIERVDNKDLINLVNYKERYVSVDDIARALMQQDKFLLLVDVRSPEQYKEFSLPGAVNIPIDSLFTETNMQLLSGSDVYNIVFFSNGSSLADKAWLMATTAGYKNLHVLKGGLNAWFNDLLQPKRPADWATKEEFQKYYFRLAAARYFTGATGSEEAASSKPAVKVQVPVKKKQVGGGCE